MTGCLPMAAGCSVSVQREGLAGCPDLNSLNSAAGWFYLLIAVFCMCTLALVQVADMAEGWK